MYTYKIHYNYKLNIIFAILFIENVWQLGNLRNDLDYRITKKNFYFTSLLERRQDSFGSRDLKFSDLMKASIVSILLLK